jgi:nucleotide-binding universal stress UspA family protein
MVTLKKILVPTDFSEHSAKAVRYAAELAAKYGAELHLFHSVETIPIAYTEGPYVPTEVVAEMEAAAVKRLDEVKIESADDLQVVRKVVQGQPFIEIVRYATDNMTDLIVIGTHGRGAIAHMLLGSVTEKIVRKAPCSVLVVRSEQHDFVMP